MTYFSYPKTIAHLYQSDKVFVYFAEATKCESTEEKNEPGSFTVGTQLFNYRKRDELVGPALNSFRIVYADFVVPCFNTEPVVGPIPPTVVVKAERHEGAFFVLLSFIQKGNKNEYDVLMKVIVDDEIIYGNILDRNAIQTLLMALGISERE